MQCFIEQLAPDPVLALDPEREAADAECSGLDPGPEDQLALDFAETLSAVYSTSRILSGGPEGQDQLRSPGEGREEEAN